MSEVRKFTVNTSNAEKVCQFSVITKKDIEINWKELNNVCIKGIQFDGCHH